MSKIRRILLKGMSGDEKLAIVSKYARILVEMGKRDSDIRALAVKIVSSCAGKDYKSEAMKLHEWVRDNIRYVKDTFEVERFRKCRYEFPASAANPSFFSADAGIICTAGYLHTFTEPGILYIAGLFCTDAADTNSTSSDLAVARAYTGSS